MVSNWKRLVVGIVPANASRAAVGCWAALICLMLGATPSADATAAMNTCNNNTQECRANLATVYSYGNTGFVTLVGHLVPTACTNAGWGYYWSLNLLDQADRARYATLLSAFLAGQPVELRAVGSDCKILAVALGEG